MIRHEPRDRPDDWEAIRARVKYRWMIPFIMFEWLWAWVAFLLSKWSFLEVLEYLGSFSVLVGVIFYFSESDHRIKQRHYEAWQVINTAQGKGGSGGRVDALQELNHDRVPLVGVDVSLAFLQGLKLPAANLSRSDFSATDMRGCDFELAQFTFADLHSANLRGCDLKRISFEYANLSHADLVGSDLTGARFNGTDLGGVDLRSTNLKDIDWQQLKNIKMTNIAGVENAPAGFVEWALKNGAIQIQDDPE
jgi:uncharacterized protein YjbI with pentapeptide repeats